MLLIPCPYCGARDETEFTYGGPSHVTRPELTASDREMDALFISSREHERALPRALAAYFRLRLLV